MDRLVGGLRLHRRKIAAGPLTILVESDDDGRLRSARLPKRIPPGLLPEDLSTVLDELERSVMTVDGLPPFHRKVWDRMRKIPWGSTMTYGTLAASIGNRRASRAVGQACAANPLALLIPCHRIVGAHHLGGFAWGIRWKEKLLDLETKPRVGT